MNIHENVEMYAKITHHESLILILKYRNFYFRPA